MNEIMELANKTNYLNKEIAYLKNVQIIEYDIHAAGFSVLKFKKVLDKETEAEWENLDKHTRTVKEGLLQKNNPEISKLIIDTLAKVRQFFCVANNVKPENILTIKKDAVFLINKTANILTVKDIFEFRNKNKYTSYINLSGIEFYYDSERDILDCKGVSKLVPENNEFLMAMKRILAAGEKLDSNSLFTVLKNYRNKYLNRELPIEAYRDILTGRFRIGKYTLENASEDMLKSIDITQNYMNFLVPLFNTLL